MDLFEIASEATISEGQSDLEDLDEELTQEQAYIFNSITGCVHVAFPVQAEGPTNRTIFIQDTAWSAAYKVTLGMPVDCYEILDSAPPFLALCRRARCQALA